MWHKMMAAVCFACAVVLPFLATAEAPMNTLLAAAALAAALALATTRRRLPR